MDDEMRRMGLPTAFSSTHGKQVECNNDGAIRYGQRRSYQQVLKPALRRKRSWKKK